MATGLNAVDLVIKRFSQMHFNLDNDELDLFLWCYVKLQYSGITAVTSKKENSSTKDVLFLVKMCSRVLV